MFLNDFIKKYQFISGIHACDNCNKPVENNNRVCDTCFNQLINKK